MENPNTRDVFPSFAKFFPLNLEVFRDLDAWMVRQRKSTLPRSASRRDRVQTYTRPVFQLSVWNVSINDDRWSSRVMRTPQCRKGKQQLYELPSRVMRTRGWISYRHSGVQQPITYLLSVGKENNNWGVKWRNQDYIVRVDRECAFWPIRLRQHTPIRMNNEGKR